MVNENDNFIEQTEPTDDEESRHIRYEITSYPSDFTVEVMNGKLKDGQIVIPEFQRRYVWTRPQASRLIESFLLGLPVPPLFLYREQRTGNFQVIDGHQRLGTIQRFFSGKFNENQVFSLIGVDERWAGKTYENLVEADRRQLDDATLRSIVIQQLAPDDHSSTYQIFERLNTGGTSLSPMEIRKAIFSGDAFETLERLNQHPAWRGLIGQPEPDRRLRDVELVLRVLALEAGWERYTKPMKQFLTEYLGVLRTKTEAERATIEGRFVEAAQAAVAALPARPFHLRGPLNVAAMDSIMASLIRTGAPDVEALGAWYQDLRAKEEWEQSVRFNTSDTSVVKKRFEIALASVPSL